jgi:hypothetical protein
MMQPRGYIGRFSDEQRNVIDRADACRVIPDATSNATGTWRADTGILGPTRLTNGGMVINGY